jgi:hypothetical protein
LVYVQKFNSLILLDVAKRLDLENGEPSDMWFSLEFAPAVMSRYSVTLGAGNIQRGYELAIDG